MHLKIEIELESTFIDCRLLTLANSTLVLLNIITLIRITFI